MRGFQLQLMFSTVTTGPRGAKFEQNVQFSLRKTTDIICYELALLALPIFLPQVKLLWALRITEIGQRVRRPRKIGLRLIAIFNIADDMAYLSEIEIEKYSNLVPRVFSSFKMAVGETPGQGC